MTDDDEIPDEVELPITGELDLHTFRPRDIGDLLPDYFEECRKRGILSVRIIHGKGTGALREGVHRVLEKLPGMASWTWPAAANYGGWGATWVVLEALPPLSIKP
ncbi:MAG: mismatch repair protein MutS [Verrucomicrobiaceae bacterium]|nr:mismatch repair protein MutS [Verrucomicrobiaceae bacterium]